MKGSFCVRMCFFSGVVIVLVNTIIIVMLMNGKIITIFSQRNSTRIIELYRLGLINSEKPSSAS